MDIIFIQGQVPKTLFRVTGKHDFAMGKDEVQKIQTVVSKPILPFKPMSIENVAGKFLDFFRMRDLDSVLFRSKRRVSKHFYHIEGTVTMHQCQVHFKGCSGVKSMERLADDLGLLHARANVFMVLMTGLVGTWVDISNGCYLERGFQSEFEGCFVPRLRVSESCSTVILDMVQWHETKFPPVAKELRPTRMVVSVSNRGTVIVRFAWPSIGWNSKTEELFQTVGQWVLETVRSMC